MTNKLIERAKEWERMGLVSTLEEKVDDSHKKDSKISKKKKEKNIESRISNSDVLVFSTPMEIYVLDSLSLSPVLVSSRNTRISSLVSHDGVLYDGCLNGKIYVTLSGREIHSFSNGWGIIGLCSHSGKLYHAIEGEGIYETFSGQKIVSHDNAFGLCSHDGGLYYAANNKLNSSSEIFEVFSGNKVADRNNCVYALSSNNGILCDLSKANDDSYSEVHETFSNNLISKKDGPGIAMASCNGELYQAYSESNIFTQNFSSVSSIHNAIASMFNSLALATNQPLVQGSTEKIYNISSGKELFSSSEVIKALCSHPRDFFIKEGILKK